VMLRAFDPQLTRDEEPDVADPYYGARGGFSEVLDQVERSCAELLAAIGRAVESGSDVVQQLDSPSR
jgi:protein-tyrosine-phosphatase